MNREQRRQLRKMIDRAKVTGEAWQLDGLAEGCSDCDAETILAGRGDKLIVGVLHDETCPVLAGVTPWRPA